MTQEFADVLTETITRLEDDGFTEVQTVTNHNSGEVRALIARVPRAWVEWAAWEVYENGNIGSGRYVSSRKVAVQCAEILANSREAIEGE